MSIVITKNHWYLESEDFCEIINPYVFNFTLKNSTISLKDFIQPVKKAFKILKKYKIDHIYIRIFNTSNQTCTAYYNIETLNPVYIHINTEILLSIDNFKLVLGHEIGHYINPYKRICKTINMFCPYWTLRIFIKIFSFCLLCIFFISLSLFLILHYMKFSNELFYIPFLFIMFYTSFHIAHYINKIFSMWIFHWEEYWCDSYGKKMFKNVKIELTYLYSNFNSDYDFKTISDTHPTDFNRIQSLSKNIRIYSIYNNELTKKIHNIKVNIINIYFNMLIDKASLNVVEPSSYK